MLVRVGIYRNNVQRSGGDGLQFPTVTKPFLIVASLPSGQAENFKDDPELIPLCLQFFSPIISFFLTFWYKQQEQTVPTALGLDISLAIYTNSVFDITTGHNRSNLSATTQGFFFLQFP